MTSNADFADNIQVITNLITAVVAVLLYYVARSQRRDHWTGAFSDLHNAFWTDKDFSEIRSCLANDNKYYEIERILTLRKKGADAVSAQEYDQIEKLDKFLNFMLRAYSIAKKLSIWPFKPRLWRELYFQYWIDEIVNGKRNAILQYYLNHYVPNGTYLPFRKKTVRYKQKRYMLRERL